MALEEPQEDAFNVQAEGYNFIIDEGLEDLYSKFVVDYNDSMLRKGFTILPTRI